MPVRTPRLPSSPSWNPNGTSGVIAIERNERRRQMGDLFKGGLLWLLGVPLILVIVLFATGIL
jgi:hypothetical protein